MPKTTLDLASLLAGVERSVRSFEHEGAPAKGVRIDFAVEASAERLSEALTAPGALGRWFAPVSGELRLGGRFQIEGNASGTITACAAPHDLAMTWEFGGDVSWLRLQVRPVGEGRTRLEIEHIARLTEHWQRFGPSATGIGWEMSLVGLAAHLQGIDVDPQWPLSEAARGLHRSSSAAWTAAAVADGSPESSAAAAAERARAFYSGEAPA